MSSLRKFSKKIFSKFQKCPKVFPKVSKRVLNLFWVKFFEKLYAQCSVEGRVFENFRKKKKIFSIFQKCTKVFSKVSKRVLNMFWGKLFEKFLPSFPWKVKSSKLFKKSKNLQNSKNNQNRSQKYPNVFRTCFGSNFSKSFFAQCSMEGRVFENFPKNQKILKIQKCPKSFPKVSKHVWTCFVANSRKNFAQFSMECRVFENFQKNISSKFQKCPKVFPKVSKRVLG